MDWNTVLIEPVKTILLRAAAFLPTLVGILIILIIGWIVAVVLRSGVIRLLKILQFDAASEKSGLTDILKRGGIKQTLSELIGGLIYWLIILLVVMAALNALGMTVVASLLDKVILYIPNVIASIFILGLGIFLSGVLSTIVHTASANAGFSQAKILGHVTQGVIIVFVIIMALEQLNIGTTILTTVVSILLASIGLAFAIAVGLGSKDIAGRLIQNLIDKLKIK